MSPLFDIAAQMVGYFVGQTEMADRAEHQQSSRPSSRSRPPGHDSRHLERRNSTSARHRRSGTLGGSAISHTRTKSRKDEGEIHKMQISETYPDNDAKSTQPNVFDGPSTTVPARQPSNHSGREHAIRSRQEEGEEEPASDDLVEGMKNVEEPVVPTMLLQDLQACYEDELRRLQKSNLEQQTHITQQNASITKLKDQVEESERWWSNAYYKQDRSLRHTEADLTKACDKIHALEASLDDCKKRIFALQPFEGPADGELSTSFKGLLNSIEDWLDINFGDVQSAIPRLSASVSVRSSALRLSHFFEDDELVAIQQFPNVSHSMLGSFILRSLASYVFGDSILIPGLDPDRQRLLSDLTKAMNRLQPAKDEEICQAWRVDMYRALESLDSERANREGYLHAFSTALLEVMAILSPDTARSREVQAACTDFVSDAALLADKIRLCTNEYETVFPFSYNEAPEQRVIYEHGLEEHDIIDGVTGMKLRHASKPIAASDGRVGEMVCVVYPGFVRKASNSKARAQLCKATVVVAFDHAVPRVGKRKDCG
ncbi:hypothetical protein LTR99_000371 [Exophiala xenobiotica]|uniref:Uncharacterized protein n=1 Tax=Vermiconidia calcicola TaxID=1690605 RepID=A0AAV9QIT3_9PEZI|nr:hypothetical protein H2202_004730 [Exophiala xenobiotica]KAK5543801.1 hypothetical protein LTR25_001416 [Vermiconidia calcicola]KAK5548479.1 hypothetical protein LTR23_001609 [Chaetothyriales sp. CCFEE 6169]KAK5197270.1 hypothetical protein LTR92_003209 [Exophiala xenobiotica]KAK5274369.1 hypothetical protein LTR96_000970 [Exophiala xenobiotica]